MNYQLIIDIILRYIFLKEQMIHQNTNLNYSKIVIKLVPIDKWETIAYRRHA